MIFEIINQDIFWFYFFVASFIKYLFIEICQKTIQFRSKFIFQHFTTPIQGKGDAVTIIMFDIVCFIDLSSMRTKQLSPKNFERLLRMYAIYFLVPKKRKR